MSDMTVVQLNSIKKHLEEGQISLTWTELKEAFLHLYTHYDSSQKQLQEANNALQDAVMEDPDFQEII